MKRNIVFILVCFSWVASAQTETEIRNHYNEVNKKIVDAIEQGYEGPLYQNQLVINKNIKSWPAVGFYADTINFWYDDDPNHLPAAERNPKNVLLKVNITRKASHLMTNEEYLYKDGNLIFYYSHEGEEGKEWETRVWFTAKGTFVKCKVDGKELTIEDLSKPEYSDFKLSIRVIQQNGNKYQDLFVKSM